MFKRDQKKILAESNDNRSAEQPCAQVAIEREQSMTERSMCFLGEQQRAAKTIKETHLEPSGFTPTNGVRPAKADRDTWWMYPTMIGLAGAFVVSGARLSQLGMDWGYFAVEKFIGQPTGSDQYMGAILLAFLAAPAIYGALAMSILKGSLGGNWRWRIGFLALPVAYYGLMTQPPDLSDCVSILPFAIGVWLIGILLSLGFDRLYGELARRVNAIRLLASLLIAVAPAALVQNHGGSVPAEIAMYCGLLFSAGFASPLSIGVYKQPAAFSAQFFALLPVLVFNLVNITFTTVCGLIGKEIGFDLGWQALLSATMITAASFAAATCGAACGGLAGRLWFTCNRGSQTMPI